MPLVSNGAEETQSIVFNSGKLNINAVVIPDISNITINQAFTEKNFRRLNSIKKRAIRRATLEQSVSFEVVGGFFRKLYEIFYSSSSADTGGTLYEVKDGQQNAITDMVITCYEDDDTATPKAYQYQVVNPVMLSANANLSTEEFATVPVEFACTEIRKFVSSGVSN